MKKLFSLIAFIAITMFFASCSTPNIKTKTDSPDIPALVQSNAEQTAALCKDTVSNFVMYQVDDKSYTYQYNVANKKTEFLNQIKREDEAGGFIFLGVLLSLVFGLIMGAIFN